MASTRTGESQPAAAAPAGSGANGDGAKAARPVASDLAAETTGACDDLRRSPDPMAVTDRYQLARPYTSSSMDL